MKLIGSLITTTVIVGLVWSVAYAQIDLTKEDSNVVKNPPAPQESKLPEATALSISNSQTRLKLNISGVSDRILLADIDELWQTFNNSALLHGKLVKQPNKVYVYYRNFEQDYLSADVSIGYADSLLGDSSFPLKRLYGNYATLLKRGSHTTSELAKAWQEIDYRQPVTSIVEIHYLGDHSQSVASELLIQYR